MEGGKILSGWNPGFLLQQRVAHEHGPAASLLEDPFFEGEDDGDPLGIPGQLAGPPGFPGPNLGSDVVEHRDFSCLGEPGNAEIQARIQPGMRSLPVTNQVVRSRSNAR